MNDGREMKGQILGTKADGETKKIAVTDDGYIKTTDTALNTIVDDIKTLLLNDINTAKGKLAIIGNIAENTTLTIDASGTNFTKSGDSVYLGADATEFNDNADLYIYLNGVLQDKGSDAIFVSTYSFYLIDALNNGDTIVIIKNI